MLTTAFALLMGISAFSGDFNAYFTDQTMRVDYIHTGNAQEAHIALDRIVSDGPWGGSTTQLIDTLNRGKFLFEVWDQAGKTLLYSRGFSTIYGEWETTGEAKKRWGAFHESLRFPWPKAPVRVVLKKRDAENNFASIWETEIDPAARAVNPAPLNSPYKRWAVLESGDPKQKVDILILGDGYTNDQMEKFHKDAKRMAGYLFEEEPFKSRKSDFNIWAVDTPSGASGSSHPHSGRFSRTILSAHYSSFDSERYVLSYDNRGIRDIASAAPYEFMVILVNNSNYGGGGIYTWQATASVDNTYADYLFVHEFGHHFADLADEYYTSDVSYELEPVTVEPYEPNVTALLDPKTLKWKDLVESGTPLPTPWDKEAFEKASMETQEKRRELRAKDAPESELEALFDAQRKRETERLGSGPWSGKVGAFEGGGYRAKGLYRPQSDCLMFTRNKVGFCKVCSRAIEAVIDLYTK